MAMPLRIHFENACYHVTIRGNARQAISSPDADCLSFLDASHPELMKWPK
jgi:hypothetical protein